jgi:hypothetical protein
MNEYKNPSFATMFERALLNTCITTKILDTNSTHPLEFVMVADI